MIGKNLFINLLFLAIFIGNLSTPINAQQKINLESLIPPAPNAAELGKYGTYPVGLVTGIPDISFPLYQVNSGSLKLPISISYHGSGNRVNDKATDLGLGWSLAAGGQISRTVFSAADDGPYGWFNYTSPPYNTLLSMNNYYTMATYNIVGNSGYDQEPDLFAYNVGGKSGKFHSDANKNFVTMPFEPIKIQKCSTCASGKTGFQITDDNGVIYNFYAYGTTATTGSSVYPGLIGPRTTISTWYLTSMISPDLTDTISFVYDTQSTNDVMEQFVQPVGENYGLNGYSVITGCNTPGCVNGHQQIESNMTYTELLIRQINFKNGRIVFNRNTLRKDTDPTNKSLDEMVVYNTSNQVIKRISFNHNYFVASPFYDDSYHYRLMLTGFVESDSAKTLNKPYKFDYNTTSLPPYNSFNVDYWGYYNGASNNSLIPVTTAYYHDFANTTIRGVTYANPDLINDYTSTFTFGDANREPSATYMNAGVLSKITYPTGGYSTFDFEPHQYSSDAYIQQQKSAGGMTYGINLRTKSTNSYSFSFPSDPGTANINSTVFASVSISFSACNVPMGDVIDTQLVVLTDITANTSQSWTHPGDLTKPYSVNTAVSLYAGHSYTLTNTVYGDNTVTVNSNMNWVENTSQHPVKTGGGLRIKAIKTYEADNSLKKEVDYVYGPGESGLGTKLFDEQSFYKNYEDVALAYYNPVMGCGTGSACTNIGVCWQRNFMGITKYNSVNYMGSPIIYPTVTVYEGTPSTNAGKTVSNFAITIDPNNFPPEFVNSGNYGAINNAWHQGELLDETSYKNAGSQYLPVSKTYYQYGIFNYRTDTAVLFKQFKQFIKNCDCYTPSDGPQPGGTPPGEGFFSLYPYPIKSGAFKRTKETKVIYDQNNPNGTISKAITTVYGNSLNLYPTKLLEDASDTTVTRITYFKYPQDTTDAVSMAMVAKNIFTPVLQVKNTKLMAGVETPVLTQQTTYKQIGNLIVKDMLKVATSNLAPEPRLMFNRYDTLGHIIMQQKTGDAKHSYIWDYQSVYPIAETVNADSSDIAYTSFEADGSGNWNIASPLRNTASGITGKQSYNLSNGACTKSGLTGTSTYIISYWSSNGLSFAVSGSTSIKRGKTVNGWTYFEHQVTGVSSVTVLGSDNIDELRLYPVNAQMTTYTYSPLIGVSSQCDSGNKITYYEYDGLGRLKNLKDHDGNLIKTYNYHYAGQ